MLAILTILLGDLGIATMALICAFVQKKIPFRLTPIVRSQDSGVSSKIVGFCRTPVFCGTPAQFAAPSSCPYLATISSIHASAESRSETLTLLVNTSVAGLAAFICFVTLSKLTVLKSPMQTAFAFAFASRMHTYFELISIA